MPFPVVCTCGQTFQVADDLAGRKVQCPGCQQVVAIPGTSPDPVHDVTNEDLGIPRKKKKKAAPPAGGGGSGGGSGAGLWIGLGLGGGLLLLSCCCLGGGVGAYFLWFAGVSEKAIHGKWRPDAAATARQGAFRYSIDQTAVLDIGEDGTFNNASFLSPGKGRWKTVRNGGGEIVIEVTYDRDSSTERLTIRPIDDGQLKVSSNKSYLENTIYKRY
jgi:hypothetical protein